jgi:hypothetical protein
MARLINRLTPKFVATVIQPGLCADGHGLHLQVGRTGGKSWIKRYTREGRTRDMGLGPLRLVSLAAARAKNTAIDVDRLNGVDPLEAKHLRREAAKVKAARVVTFRRVAEDHIQAMRHGWRGIASEAQWTQSLADHIFPIFGDLPVAAIDTALVMQAIGPLWQSHPETGSRVLQRVAMCSTGRPRTGCARGRTRPV